MVASGSRVDGADDLIRALTEGADQVTPLMTVALDGSATLVKDSTQANASHRPGPELETSDYRDSWRTGESRYEKDRDEAGGEVVTTSVYTEEPQGHRLEWGFVGTDSKGRQVNSPPYAHLGPAIDAVRPTFEAAMDAVQKKAPDWD